MNVNLLRVFDVVQLAFWLYCQVGIFLSFGHMHYAQYLDNFNLSKLKSQNIWAMELTKQESVKELYAIDPMYLMKNAT